MKRWILAVLAICTTVSMSRTKAEASVGLGDDAGRYEIVKISSGNEAECEAAYFQGNCGQIVVFVPGAVFDKESWYFLARRLQQKGVASLSLDGKTTDAVLAAIEEVKGKGFRQIVLVGGSMGGSAVLGALEGKADGCVSKAVLLAPAGGSPIGLKQVDKLFIVSKSDRLGIYSNVKKLYEQSCDPKRFVVVEGAAHAQHLFKTPQKEFLSKLIMDFVLEDT